MQDRRRGYSGRFFQLSKTERHNAIRELVANTAISNQEELRRKLVRRGFDVTQATVSRDIHDLHLYKGPDGYALPNGNGNGRVEDESSLPSIHEVLRSFGLKVKQAQNQLVLITTSGGAQAVALAVDHEDWQEIVGTLAGDDTVLIICPDQKRATQLRARLEEMIG
ncbi:MAG TPA: ArgR family transcriptional regulator [Pseudacidobacterium sp.]|jgi:transcriptional regulator of arginine metabolism|nr:ArgR family transcriptional regulator [Pseudacidobacterium sp.]